MKKILVVEDDPINLQILSDFLGAQGYEMRGAATGPDGKRGPVVLVPAIR